MRAHTDEHKVSLVLVRTAACLSLWAATVSGHRLWTDREKLFFKIELDSKEGVERGIKLGKQHNVKHLCLAPNCQAVPGVVGTTEVASRRDSSRVKVITAHGE
jgi:hypothetical protein